MLKMIEEIRAGMKSVDDKRDKGLKTPDDIVRFDDIAYDDKADCQLLDVYRPKCADKKALPVIVSVHGGGWVYGDKERYQFYCMSLAQRGFAVVNFTYRLAPEYKFPSSLEDTNSVFGWVLDNANKYSFDTKNVFAVGDSAGAHILSLYTAACTNKNFAEKFSFCIPSGFVPKAVALNCGVYKFDSDDVVNDQTKMLVSSMLESGKTDELYPLLNSVDFITNEFSPTFLMTSDGDFLRAQTPILANKLFACKVPFVVHHYVGAEKELLHVFNLDVKNKEAKICNDNECDFFRKFIG